MSNKKRYLITAVSLCLTVIMFFSMTACKKENNDDGNNITVEETTFKIFERGKSDYKIVVPASPLDNEMTAATETADFLYEACGYTFEIINDTGLTHTETGRYISVGNTALFKSSGISCDISALGVSDVRIVTKDGTAYLLGGEYGIICAAYEFLHYTVGYEYYAADEIRLDRADVIDLKKFDVSISPDIEGRNLAYYNLTNDPVHKRRLRYFAPGNDLYIGVHTEFQVLPPQPDNLRNHPEWYTETGKHLCFSNEGMKVAFIESVKQRLRDMPDGDTLSIGTEDENTYCTCKDCAAAVKKYGEPSALYILLANRVEKEVNEWMAKEYPGRKPLTVIVLAYFKQVMAPATYNAKTKAYEPNAPELVMNKNVGARLAMHGIDYSYPLNSDINKGFYENLQKWASLTDRVDIYSYAVNFKYFLINYPILFTVHSDYQSYKDYNVYYVYKDGPSRTVTPTLEELRLYVYSKLMWDSSLSFDDVVDDFMDNYYKDGADGLKEYYKLLSSWMAIRNSMFSQGDLYYNYSDQDYPIHILDSLSSALNKSFAAIEHYKQTDPAMHERLNDRIMLQKLSITYMYLKWYRDSFSNAEQRAMLTEFEHYTGKLNVLEESQGSSLTDVITAWRKSIF